MVVDLANLMTWLRRFDGGRFIAAEFMVIVGVAACFSRVQNDTWWVLAAGRGMAETGRVMLTEQFSHTAYGAPWVNIQWLGQVIFYQVHLAGGMPLLTAMCAVLVMGACFLLWTLLQGRAEDRVLIFAAALPLITPGWAVRPQVFSVLLLMLVVHLVVGERFWLLPLVFLAWANLHGAVALGLVVLLGDLIAAVTLGGRGLRQRVLSGLLSCGATFLTPVGFAYWPEVVRSLRRSQVNQIAEWQPPDLSVHHALFWVGAIVFIWLVAARWRRLESAADRTLAVGSLFLLALAVRSMRNVGPFALLAAPALSRLAWSDGGGRRVAAPRAGRVAPIIRASVFGLSVVAAAFLLRSRLIAGPPPVDWTPVSAPAAAAIRECGSPIYNHYDDGGFLIWFVPEQRIFLDSRQDPYPVALIQAQRRAERAGEYGELFRRYAIRCAVVRPDSPAVAALPGTGWRVSYRDTQWVVIKAPESRTGE